MTGSVETDLTVGLNAILKRAVGPVYRLLDRCARDARRRGWSAGDVLQASDATWWVEISRDLDLPKVWADSCVVRLDFSYDSIRTRNLLLRAYVCRRMESYPVAGCTWAMPDRTDLVDEAFSRVSADQLSEAVLCELDKRLPPADPHHWMPRRKAGTQ